MKRTALGLVGVAVCLAGSIGCSTRNQRDAKFSVQTVPSGARVYVDGEPRGDSPTNLTLRFVYDPDQPFTGIHRHFVYVKKDGYRPAGREVRLSDPTTVFFILDQQ